MQDRIERVLDSVSGRVGQLALAVGERMAASSVCVYGCCGEFRTCSVRPASTTRPRYITMSRSAMRRREHA
jgi:hypothetical protein